VPPGRSPIAVIARPPAARLATDPGVSGTARAATLRHADGAQRSRYPARTVRHILLPLLALLPLHAYATGTRADGTPSPVEQPAPPQEVSPPEQPQQLPLLLAVGDSVMLGAKDDLVALRGWEVSVDAVVCRKATVTVPGPLKCAGESFPEGISSGLDVLHAARADGTLDQTTAVVLMLGSNEGVTTPEFDQIMEGLGDIPVVVWMTNTVRWQQATNGVLRVNVKRYPNAVLLDWAHLSRGKRWFAKDRIHLNHPGRLAFAALVERAVSADSAPQ
jgi:hypothetical protein